MLDSLQEHLRKHPQQPGEKIACASMVCAPLKDFSPTALAGIQSHPEFTQGTCDCCGESVVYQSGNIPRIIKVHETAYPGMRCVITTLCIDCSQGINAVMQERGQELGPIMGNRLGDQRFRAWEKSMAAAMGVDYIDPLQEN